MQQRGEQTTIALLGANTVVSNALALLLRGAGYDVRLLSEEEPFAGAEEIFDGVKALLLAPGLGSTARNAYLDLSRSTPITARIPVIDLSAAIEEVLDDGGGPIPVAWPSPIALLVREIEAVLVPAPSGEA